MSAQRPGSRVAARCQNCRAIFAAEIADDGTIRPLGLKQGCPCGDGDFRVLE